MNKLDFAEKGKWRSSLKTRLFYKCTQVITALEITKISPGLLLICRKAEPALPK